MRPKERKARACEQAGECQHSKVKGDDGCWCVQGVGKVVLEEQARFFCELVVRQWQGLHDESTKSGKKTTHTNTNQRNQEKKEACRLHCSSSKTPADADAKNRRGCLVVCRTKKKQPKNKPHKQSNGQRNTTKKKATPPNHTIFATLFAVTMACHPTSTVAPTTERRWPHPRRISGSLLVVAATTGKENSARDFNPFFVCFVLSHLFHCFFLVI